MKPQKFNESNTSLSKPPSMTDEECGSLDIYTQGYDCISCWKPCLKERISILLFGKVWLGVLSGWTQPPVWLEGRRKMFREVSDNEKD